MSEEREFESPPVVADGTIIAGRYRVVRRIGAGGMGEVYLVQHVHTDERFAMKVLLRTVISDASALERFRREARTPARIDSEYVVRVTDADVASELGGAPFLVMELLRGQDLDSYVLSSGPVEPAECIAMLQQVARALDKAHALGIVHRDMKPENLFITRREDGTPHMKVLDFGIAKFTAGAASDLVTKTATSPGQVYGTPLYMAPEQAKGESDKISAQTDIWALGLIANRMLFGQEYWDAETLTALIAQLVYEPMRKPSERGFVLGDGYDRWFLTACNRDISARFASAGEAVFRLGQALGVIEAEAVFAPGAPVRLNSVAPPRRDSSLVVSPQSNRAGQDDLSKTEIQLAQTGIGPRPSDRSGIARVAGIALGVGVLASALVVGSGRLNGDGGEIPAPGVESSRSAAPVVGEPSASLAESAPRPELEVSPSLPASASAGPESPVVASGAPSVQATAAPIRVTPTSKATATATSKVGGTATATATATATPKPTGDALDTRR